MKFGRDGDSHSEAASTDTREEVRELAEALSLYRSAMNHVAERQATRPWKAERHPDHRFRMSLLLAPVLTAIAAAGVMVPIYGHFHHGNAAAEPVARLAPETSGPERASISDTVLMNQIDTELSEDVPDALQPLAALSDQAPANNNVSENKHATQE